VKPNNAPAKPIASQQSKIKQAKSATLLIIGGACVVIVFCLVASKTLISEASHQRRVISGKHAAVTQLKADIDAINTLSSQYKAFNSTATNIIGGTASGTGSSDGSNPQIVLDALPSQYDFPGLTASVEKLLSNRSIKLNSITGVDAEAANSSQVMPNPVPVVMNFSFSATSSFSGIKQLFKDFQLSIRPFHVVNIQLSGTDSQMTASASINTYYQPAKSLSITSQGVQ